MDIRQRFPLHYAAERGSVSENENSIFQISIRRRIDNSETKFQAKLVSQLVTGGNKRWRDMDRNTPADLAAIADVRRLLT